ncbi:hypothetical protein [uncultured Tateyamaria sp.]|uniref:hypothetical protein n=1 Tax=uncultured Tateyamaria sp. TaxID=455651 RepID=UPI00263A1288|nr:hypothetical protein [uncultured Tateyamaria sp.]
MEESLKSENPSLPSRYEDLDIGFRGRLKANKELNALISSTFRKKQITGGIGFLPIFGASGSGKTSAIMETGTHLPDTFVYQLDSENIGDKESILKSIEMAKVDADGRPIIAVVDQYEEAVATRLELPTSFIESLAILDRNELKDGGIIFVWLTTSEEFQELLVQATSRNSRILVQKNFSIDGPPKDEWPEIVLDTFAAHNSEAPLSDFDILPTDIAEISKRKDTLGDTIEAVAERLVDSIPDFQNIAEYRVCMLWPVTDGARINLIHQFTEPKQGYKLNFDAWHRSLNVQDQKTLPLHELNRARLYFDFRLIPIAAADLQPICQRLDEEKFEFRKSYTDRIRTTHLYSIISGKWNSANYAPLRERKSQRADAAREWYPSVTQHPTKIGKRIAQCFSHMGVPSEYEEKIETRHSSVTADVLCAAPFEGQRQTIIELKAFAPENTMPSTIAGQIRITLKKHAQLAGFLARQ